jgi:hypothetical protein
MPPHAALWNTPDAVTTKVTKALGALLPLYQTTDGPQLITIAKLCALTLRNPAAITSMHHQRYVGMQYTSMTVSTGTTGNTHALSIETSL